MPFVPKGLGLFTTSLGPDAESHEKPTHTFIFFQIICQKIKQAQFCLSVRSSKYRMCDVSPTVANHPEKAHDKKLYIFV